MLTIVGAEIEIMNHLNSFVLVVMDPSHTFYDSINATKRLFKPYSTHVDSHYVQNLKMVNEYNVSSQLPQPKYDKKNTTIPETTSSKQVSLAKPSPSDSLRLIRKPNISQTSATALQMSRNTPEKIVRPEWHAPWKLMRVISGHIQWVRCVAVDPTNQWFATGSNDRTIKIWDLASGQLKLTLTGHIHSVRGISISARHPYMFSVSEDKTVRCWDLEQNKVIRYYHGHLSGVYTCDLHPSLDVLVTGGRDSTGRVWDIRTKKCVHVLSGHSNTVASVKCQNADPQVITGSHDTTARCWDLRNGRTSITLTHHKKSIRSLLVHPMEYSFASASSDNIKVWKCPEAQFMRNISNGNESVLECMAINQDNVMVSGSLDGRLDFWDWKSGYGFQSEQSKVQPGSLDCEAGILDCAFDQTGSRLITCESDKTIKIWKEDENASIESYPIDMSRVYGKPLDRF